MRSGLRLGLFFLWPFSIVDNRLKRRHGARRLASTVLDTDLEELAWAITAYVRKGATVSVSSPKNVEYVRIGSSIGLDVAVRKEHWVKIVPLLQDGTFNPLLFPVENPQGLDTNVRLSPSNTRNNDLLFRRVFFYLSQLFKDKVPTGT